MKITVAIVALTLVSAVPVSADEFYDSSNALFSMRPKTSAAITHITRFGPVGLSIDLVQPAFVMRIKGVEAGSPAAATGKLKAGRYILSINGAPLAGIDPRIQMGNWITEAEATDGKLVMQVADAPDGKPERVVVTIPVLGEYSDTWPLNCAKSDKIVRNMAEYLKKPDSNEGFAGIGMLFLLSTGDPDDLAHVAKWAKQHKGTFSYPWHIGYGGLALCEYYLRTGDKSVLPAIQRMADKLASMENFGGWAGRGATAQLTYGGGGGHLNAAGTLCLGYLMLAKECGATVDDATLQRVLARFYRYSGRGNVPYGQGRPEGGYTDNGKNGKLAFSLAAAAALTPDGEDSLYARARDTSAQFSFYSTSYMLHGHTGGGIGEIWRSAAMGLVHDDLPNHYREFMDTRRWHYEMSRRFDGSFAILGGERYDNVEWGAGYALTYTVPRKTLRLTGAPPTAHSKPYQLPERPWGTAEDDDFQSIRPAAYADGKRYEITDETFVEHTAMGMFRKLSGEVDAATVAKYIRHPDFVVRGVAARKLAQHPGMVDGLLRSDDARVRYAALQGIDASRKTLLTEPVFKHLFVMLGDDKESWFVKDLALRIVGKAPEDWLAANVDAILPYLNHEEWWLQNAALMSLVPVAADQRCYKQVLPAIGKLLSTNHRYNVSGGLLWSDLPAKLRNAEPEIQKLARDSFKQAYAEFVAFEHPAERVANTVNPGMRGVVLQSLAKLPGGYDALYEIGKQQYPDQELPFKDIFLRADAKQFSPALRQLVEKNVQGNLIPGYVNKHKAVLTKEANSESLGRAGGAMEGLVKLYRELGVNDYDWVDFGPAADEMAWHYFSFDPKEKFMQADDRLGRWRDVTFPKGMDKWFAEGFDPRQAGWQRGLAPFGAAGDEKQNIAGKGGCNQSFCQCSMPIATMWEKDVLLIRGDFEFPELEPGYRYRLLHGGISHVGSGGGYQLYVNGKLFAEMKTGVDRRGGGIPIGAVITREWWDEFNDGKVTLSAISFKKHHPRTKKYGGNIMFFMQRMKVPPIE